MELLKDKEFKGLFFEILKVEKDNWHDEYMYVIVRASNHNDKKKKIALDVHYISSKKGLQDGMVFTRNFGSGRYLQPNSFVDIRVRFDYDGCINPENGDRIELIINDGRIAELLLVRNCDQWYIVEEKSNRINNQELKQKIEHFETVEERFGVSLQKFSVKTVNDNSLILYCEAIALSEDVLDVGYSVEVAIYDTDYNIVDRYEKTKSPWEFKGFEVIEFDINNLEISVEEIGRIVFYITR